MAWTEIGEFADGALYQCSYLLPARAAEPFRNENGIEWLGFYPLFHAAALWQNQGYTADGESYNAMWIPIFWYAQHSSSHGQSDRLLLTIMT